MGIVNYTYNRSTSGGEIITHLINGTDGQGLHFDGAAGNIDIPTVPDLGTKFSFEFIAQKDNTAESYLVDFYTGGRFIVGQESGDANLKIYDNTSWKTFGVAPLDDLKVHHLVVTIDGTAAILYDNGNQVGTVTIGSSHAIDSCTDAMFPSTVFAGTFYRTRFFNRTLSASDVTTLFEKADVSFADQYGSQTNKISATVDQTWSAAQADTGNDVNDRATFDAAYSWFAYNCTDISVASNVFQFSTSITTTGTYKDIGIVGGKKYRFTVRTGTITGNTYTAYAGGIGAVWEVGDLVASTTNVFEFTAAAGGNGYIYILSEDATAGTIQLDASSVSNEIVEIGCVSDYDLAFANPPQSLMVQDRAGAADGTASATGVVQVTPIEQLNSKSARIGTTVETPADGELLVSSKAGIGCDPVHQFQVNHADGGVIGATRTAGTTTGDLGVVRFGNEDVDSYLAGIYGTQDGATDSAKLAFSTQPTGGSTAIRLTIDSGGVTSLSQGTTLTTLATPTLKLGGTGVDSYAVGAKHLIGFGYSTDNTSIAAIGFNLTDATAATKGSLIFATRDTTGATDVPVTRMTIDSAGKVGIGGTPNYNFESLASNTYAYLAASAWSATNTHQPTVLLRKAASNTINAASGIATEDGEQLGAVLWEAPNTSNAWRETAGIAVTEDGANTSTRPPSKMEFSTSDGSTRSTRLTIDSAGLATFSGTIKGTGYGISLDADAPVLEFHDTGETSSDGAGKFRIQSNADLLYIQGRKDDNSDWDNRFQISRDGLATFTNPGWPLKNELTNSGFDVWSNSTLEDVTGSNIVASIGWGNYGGYYGTFTDDGTNITSAIAASGTAYARTDSGVSLTAGKLYKIVATVTRTSGASPEIFLDSAGDTAAPQDFRETLADGANTICFEYSGDNGNYIWLQTDGATNYSCTFVVTEVVPGCVAADALGPDTMTKSVNLDIWRQHNDGGTYTKDGSFYAVKATNTAATEYLYLKDTGTTKVEEIQRFAGRNVTLGVWIKTDTASHARLRFYNGDTNVYSSYHTGGNAWEWLEVTSTVDASPSSVMFAIHLAVDTKTAYISQPMLVFGSAIGSGNYSRPMGEIVNCETTIQTQNNVSLAAADDKTLNLEALSSGKIPKGCKAVYMFVEQLNSSITSNQGAWWGPSATNFTLTCNPKVNNIYQNSTGRVACDSNGDIYQEVSEAGATLSGLYQNVLSVELR